MSSSCSAPPPHASHAIRSVESIAALRRFRMTRVQRALWMTWTSLNQQVSKYNDGDNDVRIPSGETGERQPTYILRESPSFMIITPCWLLVRLSSQPWHRETTHRTKQNDAHIDDGETCIHHRQSLASASGWTSIHTQDDAVEVYSCRRAVRAIGGGCG